MTKRPVDNTNLAHTSPEALAVDATYYEMLQALIAYNHAKKMWEAAVAANETAKQSSPGSPPEGC